MGRYTPQTWYPESQFHWEGPQSTLEVHEIRTGFFIKKSLLHRLREGKNSKEGKGSRCGWSLDQTEVEMLEAAVC